MSNLKMDGEENLSVSMTDQQNAVTGKESEDQKNENELLESDTPSVQEDAPDENEAFTPMTDEEWKERELLEKTIDDAFWTVGEKIEVIMKKRLYRSTIGGKPQTWAEYCKLQLGFTKQYAARLVRAAGVIRKMRETKVSRLPTTVAQALALDVKELDSEELNGSIGLRCGYWSKRVVLGTCRVLRSGSRWQ